MIRSCSMILLVALLLVSLGAALGTAQSPCGTPATPPCPPQQSPKQSPTQTVPPVLNGFTPSQATQGSTVVVTFAGAHFVSPASAQFTPSAGISVKSISVTNSGQIQAHVTVDANAPVGARKVSLIVGKAKLQAQTAFTVVPGQPTAMRILRVTPNQLPAGSQNVELTLEGTNFVPGTLVSFTNTAGAGGDIFVDGAARYLNSSEIHVVVNVLPLALPGGRNIRLQTPKQQVVTGKGMLNVLAAKEDQK